MTSASRGRPVGAASAAMVSGKFVGAASAAMLDGRLVGAALAATESERLVGAALAAIRHVPAATAIAPEGAPTGGARREGLMGAASAAPMGGEIVGAALAAMEPLPAAAAIAPEGAPTSGNDGIPGPRPVKPHSADIRAGRVSIVGQMYLITSVTNGRRRYFDDARLARAIVRTLRQLAKNGHVDSHAFVVMPDHFHWLITLRSGTLSALMARAKGGSARQINQLLGRTREPLWQAGFHDHAVRADEDVRRIARYIVANPLRAGLVSAMGDYPWWDAQWI